MNDNLSVEVLLHSEEEYEAIPGGDNSNPTWEEYLEYYKPEFQPHIKLIREQIEKLGYLGITGEKKQELGISFKFSDGKHIGFSWRAWGDLMQAIVNKREGYMKYYM